MYMRQRGKKIRKKDITLFLLSFQKFGKNGDPLALGLAAKMNNLRLEYEKWLRVAILTDFGGRQLCHDVLFNKEQLPTDGKLLWKELDGLKFQYKDQREIVCPSSGSTDYTKFDVTLYTSIIQKKFDKKYDTLVTDLRKARNGIFHKGKKEVSNNEFEWLWKNTSDMLQKHGFDPQLIANLKVCDIFSQDPAKEIANFICQGSINRLLLL